MTERDFCFWLHGFDELSGGQRPNKEQWEMIKQHLAIAKPDILTTPIFNPFFTLDTSNITGYDPKLLDKTINITC